VDAAHPPYIIAELSANHLGRIEHALATLEAAHAAGAQAIKLQTYTADSITLDCDGPGFRIESGLWGGQTLHQLYRGAALPYEWHGALFSRGRELGLTVFSSPFDPAAVDFLESLHCPAYKIASFELVDLPLIRYAAGTGKPLIMSTGMASLEEIEEAVTAARDGGCRELALLHCVSGYPTPVDDLGLATIPDLARRFDVVVGLSDHTMSLTAPVAAIALGARLVEKHFTLSRADGGPDASFSFEPDEFRRLVEGCGECYRALGEPRYGCATSEAPNLRYRRSLYLVRDLAAGARLGPDDVRSIRPAYGLAPRHYGDVIGRRLRRDAPRGTPLSWDLLEDLARDDR